MQNKQYTSWYFFTVMSNGNQKAFFPVDDWNLMPFAQRTNDTVFHACAEINTDSCNSYYNYCRISCNQTLKIKFLYNLQWNDYFFKVHLMNEWPKSRTLYHGSVSHWPSSAESRFQSTASSCGIFDRKTGIMSSHVNIIPYYLHTLSIIHQWRYIILVTDGVNI